MRRSQNWAAASARRSWTAPAWAASVVAGEEFVVLMRCHGDADAGVALERLRSSVKAFAFPQVGSISVSAGYSQVLPGDTPPSAFERADRAVYWAKAHGRDRVCSHAALVARGELLDEAKVGDVELF